MFSKISHSIINCVFKSQMNEQTSLRQQFIATYMLIIYKIILLGKNRNCYNYCAFAHNVKPHGYY